MILQILLIPVLLWMGSALECEVCTGLGSNCSGPMETCADGQDTCAVVMVENTIDGERLLTVMKACESSHVCDGPPSYMNLGKGRYVRTSVACCVGDLCKTAHPHLAPVMNKPNGKQCPACYSFSPSGCGTEVVDCVGPENYCLDMVEKVTYGKFVIDLTMKGCITEALCASKEGEVTSANIHTNIAKATCTPASVAV
ncbi:phospholipase A2 inhibitor gamma subunit B isoform X2 [Anolis carolinensis]|uniref:phospholipase A2 inhibitor gamma subunit B isoform X2 n=1 Tax=Anolis carolinensis TaxID=28377 RepID=UPI002F2B524B